MLFSLSFLFLLLGGRAISPEIAAIRHLQCAAEKIMRQTIVRFSKFGLSNGPYGLAILLIVSLVPFVSYNLHWSWTL